MSHPTIRVQLEVNWDAGTADVDDDRSMRVEVEYPNDRRALLPDVVAERLAKFVAEMRLPLGTEPKERAAADAPRRQGVSPSRSVDL